MKFQELCPEIANTELWRLFEEKAANDHKFISAVEDICYEGGDPVKGCDPLFPNVHTP